MKKLLLLGALAIGAFAANAQDFTVTVQGTEVNNGETVDSYCLIIDEQEYKGQIFRQYQLLPEVHVTAPTDIELSITVTNTGSVADPRLQFCWPSNCEPIPVGESLTRTGKANNPEDLAIDSTWFSDMPEGGITLSCKIEIVPTANPANAFSFNLNMIGDPENNAVESIEADNAAPVYYNLNGVKVADPDHGIFILKQGGKTVKVIK